MKALRCIMIVVDHKAWVSPVGLGVLSMDTTVQVVARSPCP